MKAQVGINYRHLFLLFNKKVVVCFILFSQFIFGSSHIHNTSLQYSFGQYNQDNQTLYVVDNTIITNRQQIYIKPSASSKKGVVIYKKNKVKKNKVKKNKVKKDKSFSIKSPVIIKSSYLSDQIRRNLFGGKYFVISNYIENYKKKIIYKSVLYWFIISFIFLLILKKNFLRIWGWILLLLIKQNFTRPPPDFIIKLILLFRKNLNNE